MSDLTGSTWEPTAVAWIVASAVVAIVAGGCGFGSGSTSGDREVDRDPMVIPQSYERRPSFEDQTDSAVDFIEDDASSEEYDELVLEPNVYLLPERVADAGRVEFGRIVLPVDEYPYLTRRKAGDVLISPASPFSFRRIERVVTDDGEVVWHTERAELGEVFEEGTLYYEVGLGAEGQQAEAELMKPYLTGPLEVFRDDATGPLRRRSRALFNSDSDCEKPPRCEPKSSDAPDPCNSEGVGKPDPEMVGSCRKKGAGIDPFKKKRCTKPCDKNSDCVTDAGKWVCASDGWCTPNCSSDSSGPVDGGRQFERSWLAHYLDRELLECFEKFNSEAARILPHSYADFDANLRLKLEFQPFEGDAEVKVALEADFLAGLGLLFEFEESGTARLAIEHLEELTTIPVFGADFTVEGKVDATLNFLAATDGNWKLDFKAFTTRCENQRQQRCEDKLSWKEFVEEGGEENWKSYVETHQGKSEEGDDEGLSVGNLPAIEDLSDSSDVQSIDYGGVPGSESPRDPIIGTYARDIERRNPDLEPSAGAVIGLSTDGGCWDYGPCETSDETFADFNLHHLIGADLETRFETSVDVDLKASVGLYAPTTGGGGGGGAGSLHGTSAAGEPLIGGIGDGDSEESNCDLLDEIDSEEEEEESDDGSEDSGGTTGESTGGSSGDSETGSGDDSSGDSEESGNSEDSSDSEGENPLEGADSSKAGEVNVEGRLLFIEPINFTTSLFASFDPPYCAWGADFVYNPRVGTGPFEINGAGLGTWALSVLPEPLRLAGNTTIRPECYARKGEQPQRPSELSGDEWNETYDGKAWESDSFACRFARSLARVHPDLACGRPIDRSPSTSDVQPCPCSTANEECFAGVCVTKPEPGGVRISLSNSVKQVGLRLEVQDGTGTPIERINRAEVEDEKNETGNFEVLTLGEQPQEVRSLTIPPGDVRKGAEFYVRVRAGEQAFTTDGSGEEIPISNVNYEVEVERQFREGEDTNPDILGYEERFTGVVSEDDPRGSTVFVFKATQ